MSVSRQRSKILLFQWRASAYDSLRYLQDLLGDEFVSMGFEIERVTLGDDGWSDRLQQLLNNEEILFAMGFSGVGSDLLTGSQTLIWEASRTPFFNWCCDHPCYFPKRHAISSQWLIHGFVFPEHAQYSVEHFNATGMTSHAHLAMPSVSAFDVTHLPISQRNHRIIYTKSGKDTKLIEQGWQKLPKIQQNILFGASEELFQSSTQSALKVIQKISSENGLFLSGSNALTMNLMREIDAYIRFKRANLVIQALMDMPVDVYGAGWDHLDWAGAKGARHFGPVPLSDSRSNLAKYLGCLSIHPFVEGSVHDRNFFAIAANVVPISDSNHYSRTVMPKLEPYTFKFEVDSIRAAVSQLFAEPQQALDATEETRLSLQDEGSLNYSAKKILTYVGKLGENLKY